jgi:diguanylate cyclase (GGDEF)-like protein/hemerythrin-like metal-binding protein/PAS domain S-box-containing protein
MEAPFLRRRHDDPWLDQRYGRWTLFDGEAKSHLLEQVGVGVFVLKGSRLVYLNDAFAEMLGYSMEDCPLGQDWFDFVDARDQLWLSKAINDVMGGQKRQLRRAFRAVSKKGESVEVTCNLVRGELCGEPMLIGSTPESFANRLAVSQLNRLAFYDALTELPGKALFFDRMYQAICQARRDHCCFALLLLDLDGFKAVNDSLGHAAGDELLQQVGRRLAASVRESDSIARIGGDEFTLILRKLEDPKDAGRVAQKVINTLTEPFTLQEQQCQIGVSIGISIYPNDGDSIETLLRTADQAMYRSKREGKNTYFHFEQLNDAAPETPPRLAWRQEWECGIGAMDDQHRMLLDKLNSIFLHISQGCDAGETEARVRDLSRYTRFHFTSEELLMGRYGCANRGKHRLDHKKLMDEIDSVMSNVDVERNGVTVLLEFLKDWLIAHIREFDAPLGKELQSLGMAAAH